MGKKTLRTLLEQRDAAAEAYEAFIKPLIAENRALSEDEETTRTELRGAVERLDARIAEVREDDERKEAVKEARASLGTPDVRVTKEARTYGEDSPNSYVNDLVRASSVMWPGHGEAVQRLNRHAYEVSVEVARDSKEGRAAIARLREHRRTENGVEARKVIEEMRARGNAGSTTGLETRAGMDTTSGSGGSFVTPVYFVQDYAPYREPGRAFANVCNKQRLPEYGMTVNIPHVTGPAAVATQATQNTGVQETDPQAGYLSANLQTIAGQVTLSQQLLDRAGPNFAFDKLVFDQLHRDYDPKVDAFVLAQALAGAGSVAYTASGGFALTGAGGVGGFYGMVSNAKSNIRTGAGVVMNPTHLFTTPERWEFIAAWADANGRPVVVPDYAGAFNAVAAGNANGDAGVEGSTGYRFNGLPVYQDLNIPAPTTGNDQAIIGALDEVYVFEGELVPRVLPQTLGSDLSVILQVYSYVACIVRYAGAIQAISGTGMSAITF